MATVNAGDMRETITLYPCHHPDGMGWQRDRTCYADAQLGGKRFAPASYAVNASGITFVIRRGRVAVGDLILWRGRHYLVSAIIEINHGYLSLSAALVNISQCQQGGVLFQGALCEKYAKYSQENSFAVGYAQNQLTSILITPCGVSLTLGGTVTIGDLDWTVGVLHDTADGALQWEVWRRRDL